MGQRANRARNRRRLPARPVSDYQAVKAGDLLVQLRDDNFRAQVQQAEAGVTSGEDALINNQRQKELQVARIVQAEEGISAAEAEIAAADVGIEAAKVAIVNARSVIDENLRRLKEEVSVAIERSYNKVERTKSLVRVAKQVVALRKKNERLARNQVTQGVVLVSESQQATAATYKAEAEFLQASLGYLFAWAELKQMVGRTPGF